MKEIKKIRYNRSLMPKCPNCHKELGKDIEGKIFPYTFMETCSCGQPLEWKEKKQKLHEHFARISDNFGRHSFVLLNSEL